MKYRPQFFASRRLAALVLAASSLAGRGFAASGATAQHPVRARDIAVWKAPAVDVARLRLEDVERLRRPDGVPRVGFAMSTALTPADSGSWTAGPGGARTWQLEVRSDGALWLVLGFDRFHPAPGAELWVSAIDGPTRLGPFAAADAIEGRLWLPPIAGAAVRVELAWPAAHAGEPPDVRLGTVSHGYRPLAGGDVEASLLGTVGECEVDVNCPLGDDWRDEKRGVVLMLVNGECVCTGSLINNTSLDCTRYVYTADHCFTQCPAPAGDVTFLFNYEQPACEPGEVPAFQEVTGAQLVASYAQVDARLLRIVPAIPASFNAYFNGWNRSASAAAQSYTIHHPVGVVKKISHNDDPLVSSPPPFAGGSHWRVADWEQGVTENGSSGAPLFDPVGRIIGELHSGFSFCGCDPQVEQCADDFGRFSAAWLGGGTVPSSLFPHLDPGGTGAVTLPGMDATFCGNPTPRLVHASEQVDDAQGNDDGVPDPGDIAILQLHLANEGPASATGAVGATLTTDDPEVSVLVDHAAYPSIVGGQSGASTFPGYTIDIDPDRDCDRSILFGVEASAAQGSWTSEFRLYTGTPGVTLQPYVEDMEPPGPTGWSVQNLIGNSPWVLQSLNANSPVTSWRAPGAGTVSDSVLEAPVFQDLPAQATLRFAHAMSSGTGDGGVLEYSTNGSTWTDAADLIVTGPYNSLLAPSALSSLAGRFLWTGGDIGAWRTVELDLSSFEGGDLRFRWRFATDDSGAGSGWFVDDVVLEAPDFECAAPHDRLVPGAYCRGHRLFSMPGACGQRRPRVERTSGTAR